MMIFAVLSIIGVIDIAIVIVIVTVNIFITVIIIAIIIIVDNTPHKSDLIMFHVIYPVVWCHDDVSFSHPSTCLPDLHLNAITW